MTCDMWNLYPSSLLPN